VVLTLGAWDAVNPDHHTWFVFVALTLTSLGTGGIKPCVSTFGADQLGYSGVTPSPAATESYFYLFYFTMNVGSTAATLLIPAVRTHVSYAAAFALPAFLLLLSIIFLIIGKFSNSFIHVPPDPHGSALSRVIKLVLLARRRSKLVEAAYELPNGEIVDAHTLLTKHFSYSGKNNTSVWTPPHPPFPLHSNA
jgi:dipeptide/tripeptide permease